VGAAEVLGGTLGERVVEGRRLGGSDGDVDAEGRRLGMNVGVCEMLGESVGHVVGRLVGDGVGSRDGRRVGSRVIGDFVGSIVMDGFVGRRGSTTMTPSSTVGVAGMIGVPIDASAVEGASLFVISGTVES